MLINNLWSDITTIENVLEGTLGTEGLGFGSNLVPVDTFIVGEVSSSDLTLAQAKKRIHLAKQHGAEIAFQQITAGGGQFVALYKKVM